MAITIGGVKIGKTWAGEPRHPVKWRGTAEFVDEKGQWLFSIDASIVENRDGELFVSWPNRKMPDGKYMNMVRWERGTGDAIGKALISQMPEETSVSPIAPVMAVEAEDAPF